jgi:hypothetical protein
MSAKFWIAVFLLAAAVFVVAKWLRRVHDEDDESWDFEGERLLDLGLRASAKEPESAKID